MEVYVTMKDIVYDDGYESRVGQFALAVFSLEEKAKKWIKLLAEKQSEHWSVKVEDEDEYEFHIEGAIDSPTEGTYRVWIDDENYVKFYIVKVDFNPTEEELEERVSKGNSLYDMMQ